MTHDFVHINSKNCKACQLNVVTKQKDRWTQIIQETTMEQRITLLTYSVTELNPFFIPEISSNDSYHEKKSITRLV